MRRSELIKATCSPVEKSALRAIAEQDQKHLSEVLRDLVHAEARKRGLWPLDSRQERDDV